MNPHTVAVKFKRLTTYATFPTYGSDQAAGMDLYADLTSMTDGRNPDRHSFALKPGERQLIKCGFAMSMWEGYEAQVRSRSGLALKHGVIVLNAPGTIDSDYRGEVGVILMNTQTGDPRIAANWFNINHGDRIAQLVFAKVSQAQITFLDIKQELDQTQRGEGGFGSTGLK